MTWKSDGRGLMVAGGGMVRKALYVKKGDLSGTGWPFMTAWSEEAAGQESEHP